MSQKIGFWSVFALVTGSQIGSGVFMLPASLAPFGLLSLVGWIVSGIGAVLLALVFAKLCARFPKTGGPHVYVNEIFGRDLAFFTGWTYWIISWVSTTAVITASVGYLTPLIGSHSPFIHFLLEVALLFLITAVNFRGVKTAGNVEFFLTALKMLPLLVVPMIALFFFDVKNFVPLEEVSMQSNLSHIISHVTLLTLWGFIGLESATTPAGSVKEPSKTIPRAVVLGTLCVALLYFINSFGIMGAMPGNALMESKAPYADVTQALFGGSWHLGISLIASVVCIGTLNAWMLASGQIALGLAEDGLMPQILGQTNRHGAPYLAILVSCAGIIPLLFLTQNENLSQQINSIIDFSVTAFLFVYFICCLVYLKILIKQKASKPLQYFLPILALCFCGWVIAATPIRTLAISSLFVVSGLPVYWIYRHKMKEPAVSFS